MLEEKSLVLFCVAWDNAVVVPELMQLMEMELCGSCEWVAFQEHLWLRGGCSTGEKGYIYSTKQFNCFKPSILSLEWCTTWNTRRSSLVTCLGLF